MRIARFERARPQFSKQMNVNARLHSRPAVSSRGRPIKRRSAFWRRWRCCGIGICEHIERTERVRVTWFGRAPAKTMIVFWRGRGFVEAILATWIGRGDVNAIVITLVSERVTV